MENRLTKPLIPPDGPEKVLTLFEEDFLKKIFEKGAEAITRVIELVDSSTLLPAVERKLKVWLFNYLARNAKNNLFEQRGPVHFSPLEQQRSNQNEYYRMTGGALTPLIKMFVKETYGLPKEGYFINSIKEGHFSFIADIVFKEVSFTDISSELQRAFPSQFEALLKNLSPGIYGGEWKIQSQSFYLLFSDTNIDPLIEQFGSIRSGIGAVPDLVHLYHFLIDEGFPLERLYTLSPIPLVPVKNAAQEKVHPRAPMQTTIASLYLRFFEHHGVVPSSILEIDRDPTKSLKQKVHEIEQEVYLAYEELSFSHILSKANAPSLKEALHGIAPTPSYKATHLCTSGMSGYFHVLKELQTFYGQKPKGAFLNTTYYEIVDPSLMGEALASLCLPETGLTIDDFLDPTRDWDLLCMDLYPNNVKMDPVRIPPIEQILQTHLKTRSTPLTLILDITGTTLHDEKLSKLVGRFRQEIGEGRLHLIFISSLAKYHTGGFDKYSGGFVQVYSTSFTLEFHDPLSEEAETFFSLIFHENGAWLREYYAATQKNSDLMYHLLLPLQRENSLITLCKKDEGIPFIGLTLHGLAKKLIKGPLTNHHLTNTAYFLQYFLLAKALTRDLTLTVRDSFGFPTTNMGECGGALRFTVGIEDPSLIEEMAQWLIDEEKVLQLESIASSQTDYLLGIDPHFFISWIEKLKLILIDYGKGHSFTETLLFLYSTNNPEQIFNQIKSALSDSENEWIAHWTEELRAMLQKNFFSHQNLKNFIRHTLLPLKDPLERIYNSSSPIQKNLIKKEKKLWLDFLLIHPIEELEAYIQSVFAAHERDAQALFNQKKDPSKRLSLLN